MSQTPPSSGPKFLPRHSGPGGPVLPDNLDANLPDVIDQVALARLYGDAFAPIYVRLAYTPA